MIRVVLASAALVGALSTTARADDDDPASTPSPPSIAPEHGLPAYAAGWFATAGFAYLPSGIDGPGDITAEIFEAGYAIRWYKLELRAAAALALESTYFQSSVNVLAMAHVNRYLTERFSWGVGLGLGGGSFSPNGNGHADDGATPVIAVTGNLATLHFGQRGQVELGLEAGTLFLLSFGESDWFYQLHIGYAAW